VEQRDVVVAGGGIAGLAFAHHAAAAGRSVLVLEAGPRTGGCLNTRRLADGFWYEVGAHTAYNSYGAFLDLVEACGLRGAICPRGDARKRFALLRDGRLAMMGPLSVFLKFDPIELLLTAPFGLFRSKEDRTTAEAYGGIVGRRNYANVLAPFLAAVPSQNADGFPARGPGSLFKTRARRKDVVKSFTLDGGLSTLADALARRPNVEVRTGAPVREVRRDGAGFSVICEDGTRHAAHVAALAVPPPAAEALVAGSDPALAAALGTIGSARVETTAVALPREKTSLPEMAFLVPVNDLFYSAVTRDPVPNARLRGFAFHFKPGHAREDRLRRIEEVLGARREAFVDVAESSLVLPAPALGHADAVARIDRALAGSRLAVTGNFFDGLALEDCVLRSKAEWARVRPEAG
jgi:protoporphyrinogen/coproporphyrinogen III oxidase